MKATYWIIAIFLATACMRHPAQDSEPNEKVQILAAAFDARLSSFNQLLDKDGYFERSDCDLALWAGEAVYAGVKVNLDLLEYAPGEIHRRPLPACWDRKHGDQGAKSTTSPDMLTGYMLGRWAEQNLDAFKRLETYGTEHIVAAPIPGWKMGEPYPGEASRVVMRTNGIGTVSRAIMALSSGSDSPDASNIPPVYLPVATDYEQHVEAVGVFLDGAVAERLDKLSLVLDVTSNELEALKALTKASPEDELFQAVLGKYTGDQAPAVDLLLSPDTPVPTYVRGNEAFAKVHWLFAARIVLDSYPKQEQQ